MTKLTVLEKIIISFFVGVVASAYVTFLLGSSIPLGSFLSLLSLEPFFTHPSLVISFLFFIAVYGVYSYIILEIVHHFPKSKVFLALLIGAIGVGAFFDQKSQAPIAQEDNSFVAAAFVPLKKVILETPQTYFGQEARGDLNGDGLDDVAFILHRNDPDRGHLYYFSGALATTTGHQGLDIAFLGDSFDPKTISIASSTVEIVSEKDEKKTATLRGEEWVVATETEVR